MAILAISSCMQQSERVCVAAVVDGDILELKNGEIVRLIGIDAPERSEYGGSTAVEYFASLLGKEVMLVIL